jgi:hypothetical protein
VTPSTGSHSFPIGFVKYYERASTILGADQMAAAFRARGWRAHSLWRHEIDRVQDGVLVFIKTTRIMDLLAARSRRNRIVVDVQDTLAFKRRIKNAALVHACLYRNARQMKDYGSAKRPDRLIYQHWDPRYVPNTVGRGRLRAGYLGSPRSFPLWGKVPDVAYIASDFFEGSRTINCHVSVRPPGREFFYKPNCKVSTAAACGAVLITTRDASSLELLGEGYPFYCGGDVGSVSDCIARATDSLGTVTWSHAEERLRTVRARTSIEMVTSEYESFLRDVRDLPRA